jgi:DNA polymerase III epsilon subunit-like protein
MTKIVFLDCETTGLEGSRLIELTYNGVTIRCRPPVSIEPGASQVNGFHDSDVEDLPHFQDMIEYSIVKYQLENSIVVAHNAPFDIGVLMREGINIRYWIDTKEAAQKLLKLKNYSLQNLREHLGIHIIGNAHTSQGDVAVLKEVWKRLNLDSIKGQFVHDTRADGQKGL